MTSDDSAGQSPTDPHASVITGRAARRICVLENLDVASLLLLAVLAAGAFLAGWGLRPSVSVLPPVPAAPHIIINLPATRPVRGLYILSYLVQSKGSTTELQINALGSLASGQTAISWSMGVLNFSGKFCTPKQYEHQNKVKLFAAQDYMVNGTTPIRPNSSPIPIPGSEDLLLVVHLCWHTSPPLEIDSSYFSVKFPAIVVPNQTGTLISGLELHETSLSDYSPSGGLEPIATSPDTWTWSTVLSGIFGSPPDAELLVSGSDSSEIERETRNAFYSGIFFGIAGGALLALIPALPIVTDRMMSRRKASKQADGSGMADPRSGSQAPS
jgi:hypothetical protein